jgi:8-oxo-dGTP pyrophosphatase MutT (NUDIX family)
MHKVKYKKYNTQFFATSFMLPTLRKDYAIKCNKIDTSCSHEVSRNNYYSIKTEGEFDRAISSNFSAQRNNYKKEFKGCKENIPSFGLILFFCSKNNEGELVVEFLIQQRRDTFEYVEFMQGLWLTEERLKELFISMTHLERDRIYAHTFEELWDDLWIDKTTRMYKDGYARAKKRYDDIFNLKSYIEEANKSIDNKLSSLPWGFPKGRKHYYSETEQECAIRETEEESRVPRDLYRVLPFKYSEKFTGSNGVSYSTEYFLCEVKERFIPPRIETKKCIRTSSISEEVSDVVWVSYDDACKLLNVQRQSILYEACQTIKMYVAKKQSLNTRKTEH